MNRSHPIHSCWRLAHRAACVLLALVAASALAQVPSFVVDAMYSNADGSVQFVVLRESAARDGQQAFANLTMTATDLRGATRTYRFARDLPAASTAGSRVLIGSVGFQALDLVAPDFVMPDRFLPVDGGSLSLFAGADMVAYALLPTSGTLARSRDGSYLPNMATSFAGQSGTVPVRPVTVVEFHNASLDHYFASPLAPDIEALDSGRLPGWTRTGRTFAAWSSAASGTSVSPVCRFYIPPDKGDSHFFSASPAECAEVLQRSVTDPAYAGVVQESATAFYIALPDTVTGACASGTVPVYRLWNGRSDSNHRYTTDRAVRDAMMARGYVSEGYGPEGVAMCAPDVRTQEVVKVSDTTPFAPNCHASGGSLYANAEVEPYLAVNPGNPDNLIAVWQQDRWSNGGARGTLTGISFDGGRTWERRQVPFSRCSGGNAGNGGNFDRATDPWVTFSPDGTAHQVALAFTGETLAPGSSGAVSVSRSTDGGRTWSNPIAVIADGQDFFNDKEAITADPSDARFVFASWDRLARGGGGPAYFARTTDGGVSWEPARAIFDPGSTSQTINNIPVVLPNGTLLNFFTRIDVVDGRNVATLSIMRSPDKGASWDAPVTIGPQQSIGVRDPETGTPVRDATLIASIAVSRTGTLGLVWQDARFSGGQRDGIAFAHSIDGGRTWSAPVQVNRDPLVQAFVPTVAFRDDGTIGVSYYDFRSNTADARDLPTDYWLAQSSDGVTWHESRVAGPFDLAIAPNANGLFVGDYMALAGRGSGFLSLFGATNNANFANRTDIGLAFVASPPRVAVVGKAGVADAKAYIAKTASAMAMRGEIAARHDSAIRAAMQRRVAGWKSPQEPVMKNDTR